MPLEFMELHSRNLAGHLKLHQSTDIHSMAKCGLKIMGIDEKMSGLRGTTIDNRWHLP
jgi:hypothetical protein